MYIIWTDNGITLEWKGFDEEKLKRMGEGASAEWRKREGDERKFESENDELEWSVVLG